MNRNDRGHGGNDRRWFAGRGVTDRKRGGNDRRWFAGRGGSDRGRGGNDRRWFAGRGGSDRGRGANDRRWLLYLGAGLIAASLILFVAHYLIFRDVRNLFFYLLHGLALVPLEVLIVGVVLERLITVREKRRVRHKLNMVIGAFFSELGTPLLSELLPAMEAAPGIREQLNLKASWKKDDFSKARRFAQDLDGNVRLEAIDREALRAYLTTQRMFVLRLLENPNLMEHERFTDLLWAVLHLEEELEARIALVTLLPTDEAHLEIDVRRAFTALLAEWLLYVEHLKADYPYLFSLVVRTHPFQEAPSAIVAA